MKKQKMYRLANGVVVTPSPRGIDGEYVIVEGIEDKAYSAYTKGEILQLLTNGNPNSLFHTGGAHGLKCNIVAEIKHGTKKTL